MGLSPRRRRRLSATIALTTLVLAFGVALVLRGGDPTTELTSSAQQPLALPTDTKPQGDGAGDRKADRTESAEPSPTVTATPTPAVLSDEAHAEAVPDDANGADAADEDAEAVASEDDDAPQLVQAGEGSLHTVRGEGERIGDGPLVRYAVEVERGLPDDPDAFAAEVARILRDERSWAADGGASFQQVDAEPVELRITLAAPDLTDQMCAPLETEGEVSCFTAADGRPRAVINQNRWQAAVPHYNGDIEGYRSYVVNHEVGHALGYGHVDCPGQGEPAPVMQQQTYDLNGCVRNVWPYPDPAVAQLVRQAREDGTLEDGDREPPGDTLDG